MSEFPGSGGDASVRAFEGVLELMSELFFASLEPGNNYVTRPIILNTALYYALGYARGNYVNKPVNKRAKKQKPSYVEDTSDIASTLYVSPAQPIGNIRYTSELANARSDDYIQSNRPAKQMNSPTGKIGTRKQIQPGARFRFYVLTFDGKEPDMPPYIRIGKKRSKSLIEWKEIPVSTAAGEFIMNHPVLVDDLAEMPVGDISFRRMQPFDVIERGRFTGQYLTLDGKTPTSGVVFPAGIRFLRRHRV
ncbi:type I-D CRISPR-associated protein Cas5/Csc1 [Methanocalculus sp.]|uniref:type I-D CRISPR-associated protein Cas5/Csc1 n=1 Tax=Methanocalculus sp. TaxID=2004547 RepID=UPI0026186EB8|nr:type I-D CRISPR-associated protein Cas5/Csc1 [Methanocalculus sp.]MDG6249261.1 type I-D CRISPR-associated protein Cas5/Csc1 [Methanocalculus sp.]